MCDLGLPCGKLDCPCTGALKPLGEDVSALRRLEARRATVSDSVYSLDRMREATIQIRVPVGSPIILRAHDKTLSHSVRYAPVRKPAFATLHVLSLSVASCHNIATPRSLSQDGVRITLTIFLTRLFRLFLCLEGPRQQRQLATHVFEKQPPLDNFAHPRLVGHHAGFHM